MSGIKTIILCGGLGTRMKEETEFKPKPLVNVGGIPILWHIMKIYQHYGFNEFILALGYKGHMIREYFERRNKDGFKIYFVDTGLEALTGERILRSKHLINEDEFMVTYGDGVTNLDIGDLVNFHRRQGTIGTLTGVNPHSKYGLIVSDDKTKRVKGFAQKPRLHDFVNGGFMVFKKEALNHFDKGIMEDIFPRLIEKNELSVYEHTGFWKAMDNYREMEEMNELWNTQKPWAVWLKRN